VRIADVARVELGAEEADMVAKYNDEAGVYLGVWPLVGANEIEVATALRGRDGPSMRPTLPPDVDMQLAYDGTMFMRERSTEITKTLLETIGSSASVVFLFLGSIRTALVPLVAMPVSLIGAAA
jgi:multidrug efflux pump